MPNKSGEITVNVERVPEVTLDFLRPHARKAVSSDSNAATLRYALVELEKRLRAEEGVGLTYTLNPPKET